MRPAARGGRRRRAGQALALQVMLDVAISSRRPPAARWRQALAPQVMVDVTSSLRRPPAARRPRAGVAARDNLGVFTRVSFFSVLRESNVYAVLKHLYG